MPRKQLTLFGGEQGWPEGFRYRPDLVPPAQEEALLQRVKELPFKEFEFQGFVGKRRTVSYGWHYDFNDRVLRKAEDLPPFLFAAGDRGRLCRYGGKSTPAGARDRIHGGSQHRVASGQGGF